MTALKTQKKTTSVAAFLAAIPEEERRADCKRLVKIMTEITGDEPAMWGDSIVGFGHYHYRYASGREGDWFLAGFSPRKRNLTIYVMSCFAGCDALMDKLGRHTTGKSCLYIKKLADVDEEILKAVLESSVDYITKRYSSSTS